MGVLALFLSLYPAFVLCYTWIHVFKSDLRGGRHGPLDAYRHALASSVVAYTLGEPTVNVITRLFESSGRDSNQMDGHNNRIGARIGVQSQSFFDLEPSVRQCVLSGAVDSADMDQITWLPEKQWRDGRIW